MLAQIALGSILMMLTTVVHAVGTVAALEVLRRAGVRGLASRLRRTSLIAGLVFLMFLIALFEIFLWAALYLRLGAISGLEPAMYFSTVTFTTLGYGDVTLGESWRLLASFEGANGILLFGWTTALVFAFVRRIAAHDEALVARFRAS